MSPHHNESAEIPHWLHKLAHNWVRFQIALASALVAGLASVSFGLNPIPQNIPIQDLINRYPTPSLGLGGALVVFSAFAFVLERQSALRELDETKPRSGARAHAGQQSPTVSTGPAPRLALFGTIALALVSLGILVAGGALAFSSEQQLVQAPVRTINEFCFDLTHVDPTRADDPHYADAFRLISTRAQYQPQLGAFVVTFEHVSHLKDVIDGPVKQCGLVNGAQSVVIENNTARGLVRLVRRKTFSGYYHLVYEQNTWRLDRVDSSLGATNILPLATAEDMCNALVARNFGTAYDYLSAAAQTTFGTADNLARATLPGQSQSGDAGFQACQTEYPTFGYSSGGAVASVVIDVTIRYAGSGSNGGACLDKLFAAQIALVDIAVGAWRVNHLNVGVNPIAQKTCSGATS